MRAKKMKRNKYYDKFKLNEDEKKFNDNCIKVKAKKGEMYI